MMSPSLIGSEPGSRLRRRRAGRRGATRGHGRTAMRWLGIFVVLAVAAMTVLAALARPNLKMMVERAAIWAGFGVTQAEIKGNRFTSEADIRTALELDGARSQLLLDLPQMRRRIEALPWVETAQVRRILPFAIAVVVTERKPVAVWRDRTRDVLVDAVGRTLSAVARGSDTGLLVLTGEGAGPSAPTILSHLRDNRRIADRVVEVRRIADRRWSLLLDRETLVHLPGDGVAAALAWLDKEAGDGFLDRGLAVIDLRVHGQLVVRRTAIPSSRTATVGVDR